MADGGMPGDDGGSHIVCQTATSACQELMKDSTDDERRSVLNYIINLLPESETLPLASSLFENILVKRDRNLEGFMPKDFIEKAVNATHILALNNVESNMLYNFVRAVSCTQYDTQHLPLDSLPFSVMSLMLGSLFESGAEEFHMSENGQKLTAWLYQNGLTFGTENFIDQMNKLFFPWAHVQYKITEENKIVLNVAGEYKSTLQQSDELGILETMVLNPVHKRVELCSLQDQNIGFDIEEDEQEEVLSEAQSNVGSSMFVMKPENNQDADEFISKLDLDKTIKMESEGIVVKTEKDESTMSQFKCHLCDKPFAETEELRSHMRYVHYLNDDGCFQCPQCDQVFSTYEELLKHELEHVFKCDDCKKMFTRKVELDNHLKLHESSDAVCNVCKGSFPSKAQLLSHRAHAHDQSQFHCEYCTDAFPQMKMLRYHIAVEHPDKPKYYTCSECGKQLLLPETLRRHMEKVHYSDEKLQCHLCKKSFKKELAHSYHMEREHNITTGQLLKCPQCNQSFGTKFALIKHKANYHPVEKSYSCPGCMKSFPTKVALKNHKASEHPEKASLKCSVCDESFKSERQRIKHEKDVHEITRPRAKFECEECSASFGDRYAYERHVNKHLGVKNHHCDLCEGAFHTQRHLTRHIAHVHEGKPTRKNKPPRVSCSQCEKTFVEQRFLTRHEQREHLGRTDYDTHPCPKCSQSFSGKSSLTRHLKRVHYGIKETSRDFQCDMCAKTFMHKQGMQRHMQSVHKMLISEFECPVCHKHFASSYNLRKHQENHNGSTCKPRRKRSKLLNLQALPANFELNQLVDKSQLIEIQVMDVQNSGIQTYPAPENITVSDVTAFPAGATWSIQDAATGNNTAPIAESLAQTQFVLEQADAGGAEIQQISTEESDSQQILIQNTELQEWDASNEKMDIQGEVVEVPPGVQFIQLGGKIVRLDGSV